MLNQKIYKLLIGTNNKGKLREIKRLLPKNIKIYSTSEFNIKSPSENGKTFKENSLIKSKYFSKKTGLICLADDSGLEIDFLDKSPGIFSARWGGKNGDFSKAIKRVYKELNKKDKSWKNKKITARFICALSISYLDKEIACVLGKIEGKISLSQKEKEVLVMIQSLFLKIEKLLLDRWLHCKNKKKLIIDIKLLKKLKNFYKFTIINFIKVKSMIDLIIFNIKYTYFSLK